MISNIRNKANQVLPESLIQVMTPDIEGYEDMNDEEKREAKIAYAARMGGKAVGLYTHAKNYTNKTKDAAITVVASEAEKAWENLDDESKAKIMQKVDQSKDLAVEGYEAAKTVGGHAMKGMQEGKEIADKMAKDAWESLPEETKQLILDRQAASDKWKERIKVKALELAEPMVDKALDIARVKVVEAATNDNDMPKAVVKTIDYGVTSVWPDIVIEVKGAMNRAIRKLDDINEGEPPNGCSTIKAFILYHMYPYNLSPWGQMKLPGYWLLYLIMAFPLFGVRMFCFLMLLILIDKKDEYQLLHFIMSLKGFQFISGCVIASVIGAVQYYMCLNFMNTSNGNNFTCDEIGPGSASTFLIEALVFFFQVTLVWIAFLFIPYSIKKGERKFLHEEELQSKSNPDDVSKRPEIRRLKKLLLWDTFAFLISAGCFAYIVYEKTYHDYETGEILTSFGDITENWQFKADLYWMMVVYSGLSAPFMLWVLPVASNLVSHAKPTGYSKYGVCIPKMPPKPRDRTQDMATELVEMKTA